MKEIKQEELTALIESGKSGLVYFYTPLCGTCQIASKMLHVADELVTCEIAQMNLNFYSNLAVSLEIESVPCLLVIKGGSIAAKMYAFHSVPFLIEKINTLLKADV